MKKIYQFFQKINVWLASFGADRYLHLLAGIIIAFAVCMVMKAAEGVSSWICALMAVIASAALGVGKEVLDQNYTGQSSWPDIIFTCIGGVFGCVMWLL